MSITLPSPIRWPQRAGGQRVRSARHVLGAAADGDVGIAEHDRLRGRDDRLQAAAAQPVQRQAGRPLIDAAVERGHARQVHVPRFGVDHVAEHDMADLGSGDLGAGQRLLDDPAPSCVGGRSLRLPPKVPMAVRTALTTTTSRMAVSLW
jgi:hypothetical protein